MAEVNTKPFICLVEGCDMTFTNQDHLDWHKKKHDMMLNLGLANCKNGEIADQTPTPTRFIRNCEEVGLFQDLQNNPFDEIFKKATEDVKAGHTLEIPQTSTDDTLHTPQIYPQVDHGRPVEFESKPNCGELRLVINEVPQENSNQNESITEELMIDDSDDEERMAKTKLKPVISAMKKKIKEAINKKDVASGTIAPVPLHKLKTVNPEVDHMREMNRAAQVRCRQRKAKIWHDMVVEVNDLRSENSRLRLLNMTLTCQVKELQAKLVASATQEMRTTSVVDHNTLQSATNPINDTGKSKRVLGKNAVPTGAIAANFKSSNLTPPVISIPSQVPQVPTGTNSVLFIVPPNSNLPMPLVQVQNTSKPNVVKAKPSFRKIAPKAKKTSK